MDVAGFFALREVWQMADTAVLEAPGTIAPLEGAPSDVEETELGAPVETEAPDEAGDSPLAGLTDEEIEQLPEVRKRLEAATYQREQAIKDATAAAADRAAKEAQRAEQQAQWGRLQNQASEQNRNALLSDWNAEFARLKKAADEGVEAQPNWTRLRQMADAIDLQSRTRSSQSMTDALFAYQKEFYPDHAIDPDVLSAVEQARAVHAPEQVLQFWLVDHDAAVRAQAIKDYEAARAAERAGNAAVDGKADRVRQSAESRAAAPRPTNVGGVSATQRRYTRAEIEAMPTKEWDALPAERRAWILENKKD